MKKIVNALLCTVALSLLLMPAVSSAKVKQPKLNKTIVELKSGKSVSIKVKNAKSTVKWKVNNRNSFKTIKVWGKKKSSLTLKTGNVTKDTLVIVTAKVKSKKLKCIVCLKADEVVETSMPTYAPIDVTPPSIAPTLTATPTPNLSQEDYFDAVVEYLKAEGKKTKDGNGAVKGKVSYYGKTLYFWELDNQKGNCIIMRRGYAQGDIKLNYEDINVTADAIINFSSFKGDGTDSFFWHFNYWGDWKGNMSSDAADAAVAKILKDICLNRATYLGNVTLQDLGFTSYIYK